VSASGNFFTCRGCVQLGIVLCFFEHAGVLLAEAAESGSNLAAKLVIFLGIEFEVLVRSDLLECGLVVELVNGVARHGGVVLAHEILDHVLAVDLDPVRDEEHSDEEDTNHANLFVLSFLCHAVVLPNDIVGFGGLRHFTVNVQNVKSFLLLEQIECFFVFRRDESANGRDQVFALYRHQVVKLTIGLDQAFIVLNLDSLASLFKLVKDLVRVLECEVDVCNTNPGGICPSHAFFKLLRLGHIS
jgi:hypothetical protein